MMEKKLENNYIAPYFPHGLKFTDGKSMWELVGMNSDGEMRLLEAQYRGEINHRDGWNGIKPILRPLSSLTKPITHKGETFVPVEWFEIGDDPGEAVDYGKYNIKVIASLEAIAKHNIHHDIQYLPYGAVQNLREWMFDTNGLIESCLAIDVNTLTENPYAK